MPAVTLGDTTHIENATAAGNAADQVRKSLTAAANSAGRSIAVR